MSSRDVDSWGDAAVGEARGRLDVLLVYEDLSTGLRARYAFEQVRRQLNPEADLNLHLWRFDLLRQPPLLERAAREAAKADVVFLSAHGQGELPGIVNSWLAQWAERRHGGPCALVVLLDTRGGDASTANSALEALRTRALAAGVNVFVHAPGTRQTEWDSASDEISPLPETPAAPPVHILHGDGRHLHRDWGINE